jgi:hypothetical protein
MKRNFLLLLIAVAAGCSFAQSGSSSAWRVDLRLLEESGNPLADARVWIAYRSPREGEPTDPFAPNGWAAAGTTDTNGTFAASRVNTNSSSLGIHAQKAGYYSAVVVYDLGTSYDSSRWNLHPVWILKKITRPIPMYVRLVEKGPPVFNKPVGYDLMAGDWIAPHGKGQTADVIFTGQLEKKAADDFDYKLTVSFPKVEDGIQEFAVPQSEAGSQLRSPHEAPTDGYQSQVTRILARHPGQGVVDDSDRNRNYFFRVRTVLDENGNVRSALYGKIYGDFMQFRYYLNPTPNSRNVEFDPKQNLLKGSQSFERVTEP